MSSFFPRVRLNEAVGNSGRIIGGPFGSDLTADDYVSSGVPVIRVTNQVGKTVAGEFVYVTADKAKKLSANIARPGDIVVVQRGSTYGKVSKIPERADYAEYVVCQSQMAISVDESAISREYLFQALLSSFFHRHVEASVIQTGQPHINLGILRDAKLPIPPLPEQRRIAEILGTWDEAIEKQEALLAAKDRRRKGILQQILGNGVDFPRDWKATALSAITTRVGRSNDGGDHPVMTISAKSGFLMQSEKFARDMAGSSIDKYTLLHQGEFAYNKGNSKTAPYGCIFALDRPTAVIPFVYFCFRLNDGHDHRFFEQMFKAGILNHQLSKVINSGVRNDGLLNLYADDFFSCVVPVPPRDEQERISRAIAALNDDMALTENEIAALQRQKRGLMQKLLAGEWRVAAISEAEVVE